MTELDEDKLRADQAARQQLLAHRDVEDIQFVMNSEQGRRVVWAMLEKGQVFASCFNADPCITAFKEGQRNLALVLFQRVMTHCADQYLKMAAEAQEESK